MASKEPKKKTTSETDYKLYSLHSGKVVEVDPTDPKGLNLIAAKYAYNITRNDK